MKKNKIYVVMAVCIMLSMMIVGCNRGGDEQSDGSVKIGYSLSVMSHEWYQNIVQGAEIRAKEVGANIVFADANMDSGKQVSDIETLIAQNIDILVITPVDAKALTSSIELAHSKGIQVITESNVVEGADSHVGIKNFESAKQTGVWMGEKANKEGIDLKVLLVGQETLEDCRQRVAGFLAGLDEVGVSYSVVQEINAEGSKEKALEKATNALTAHPEVNVIFGINDNSATGGMAAYTTLGLDESKLTVIGFGFEGVVGQSALLEGTPYQASLAMFPNYLGVGLVDVSMKIVQGQEVPASYVTPTMVITRENFDTFYTLVDGKYEMNFNEIRKIDKNM